MALVSGPGRPDIYTRAVTLLATPGAVTLDVADVGTTACAAAVVAGSELFLLAQPGPTAHAVRRHHPVEVRLTGQARSCDSDASGVAARLELSGPARPVPDRQRSEVAVALWDIAGRPELLDAMGDEGWLLAAVTLRTASWHHGDSVLAIEPVGLWIAEVDEVLRWSPAVCAQLNVAHPQVAEAIAGQPAWIAEVDRDGVTLELDAVPGAFVRAHWARPCNDLSDLHQAIAHSPLPRAWAPTEHDLPVRVVAVRGTEGTSHGN